MPTVGTKNLQAVLESIYLSISASLNPLQQQLLCIKHVSQYLSLMVGEKPFLTIGTV